MIYIDKLNKNELNVTFQYNSELVKKIEKLKEGGGKQIKNTG